MTFIDGNSTSTPGHHRTLTTVTTPVVKVVMCSRGAQPMRSRRTEISIQCCTQKLHFKLTAYFPLAFKSRFMMKTAQETASRKRK